MTVLSDLIKANKSKFEINPAELKKRVSRALSIYDLVQPPVNLDSSAHSRLKVYYTTLQHLLIGSTEKLSSGDYTLDNKNSINSGNGFVISFLKSDVLQKQDKEVLKKQIKEALLADLEANKQDWIRETTAELATKAEAEAVLTAQEGVNKLQADLLQLMNT